MYILRGYQEEAVNAGIKFFKSPVPINSIILLPTGSGKSLVIAGIVKELKEPTLILQPTKEILEQNIGKFREYVGGSLRATIYSASFSQKNLSKVTFATIGSIIRKKELFTEFKNVIIDECHLVNAKGGMYSEFLDFLNVKTLGLTATPYRLVTDGFGGSILKFLTRTRPRLFKNVIYYVQNKTLFDSGYLAKLDYIDGSDGFDSTKIKKNSTGADYDDKSLKKYRKKVGQNQKTEDAIKHYAKTSKGILVFTKFVKDSEEIIDSIPNSAMVSADTKKKDRDRIIQDFRSGTLQVVCNVGVLTIGFDYLELDTVIIDRLTMSLALYYQMIGRGIRPHPKKEFTTIVDLCGNFKTFGKVEDLEFQDNNGLYYIKNKEKQLTNVYFGEKPKFFKGKYKQGIFRRKRF